MKRVSILITLLVVTLLSLHAQEEERLRVAVFDPSSTGTSIDDGTKIAVREVISSTFVNTGKYNIVERSLLEKVMKEQEFSNSGIVDDMQATEVGKLAGANKVVLSVITLTGGRNMLSVKLIDVKTANVDRQKVKIVTSGEELLDAVEPLTLELLGEKSPELQSTNRIAITNENHSKQTDSTPKVISKTSQSPPSEDEIVLYFEGYIPEKKEHEDNIITVFFDKELVGSGTLKEGFYIKIKNLKPGIHKIRFGAKRAGEITKFKINTVQKKYFEFRIYHWKYIGTNMYSVVLK